MADKDQMREISEQLEQGVRDLFTTEQYTTYLKTMSRFHRYSVNNTILIARQNPGATLVAGYADWRDKFHRQVKQGEKGIRIIAPVPVRRRFQETVRDEKTGEIRRNADGTPKTEEIIRTIPRFRAVTVFDVSQTEGEPLPERPNAKELTAGVDNFDSFLRAMRTVSPVPLRFGDISGTANGYYDPAGKEIVIRGDLRSESQIIKTALHELAHARLHDPGRLRERGTKEPDQVTREVEAESVAYTVCQYFGIDTSDYTFPYIAAWSGSVEMKELRESMDRIRETASGLIDALSEELARERTPKETAAEDPPDPDFALRGEDLPPQCYSVQPETGELIILKQGESGYYRTTAAPGDGAVNRDLADRYNKEIGVTRAQEEAMLAGSMFGWDRRKPEHSGKEEIVR